MMDPLTIPGDVKFSSSVRVSGSALACRRGGRQVFENLNFAVQAGDFVRLSGKNGSGKSTFLRCLAGFLPFQNGEFSYCHGDDVHRALNPDDFLLSGHQNGLKPNFTLRENAKFFAKLMTGTAPRADTLGHAASVFGLGALLNEPVQYFSSGQRHRAALMRFALVSRQVWLMDEPTVGLDAENRAVLAQLIVAHKARGGIIIAATHDPMDVPGDTLDMDAFQTRNSVVDEDWL